jgi:hypothetical protein
MQTRTVVIAGAALAVGGWLLFSSASQGSGLPYESSWDAALTAAKASRRPIFLHFGGMW